jgi:hypothetical protein
MRIALNNGSKDNNNIIFNSQILLIVTCKLHRPFGVNVIYVVS